MSGVRPETIGAIPGGSPSLYALVPRGVIVMWSGQLRDIPSGWALCDGRGGTPNLTAKFVRGVSTATTNPGTTGGSDTHLHGHSSTHQHEINDNAVASGSAEAARRTGSLGTGSTVTSLNKPSSNESASGSAARQKTTAVAPGNTDSADGRPAFFELAFIMKL